jgi:hypothetical protein
VEAQRVLLRGLYQVYLAPVDFVLAPCLAGRLIVESISRGEIAGVVASDSR